MESRKWKVENRATFYLPHSTCRVRPAEGTVGSPPFSLERIQAGHRFSPLVYVVSADLIRRYADAVDDFNLIYMDPEKASVGPFGRVIAPPTLASLFVLKAYRTDGAPPPGGIHLGQRFKFRGPICPGDVLSVQGELTAKEKKKGDWHLTFACQAENQRGEIVVLSESTSVWGGIKKEAGEDEKANRTHFRDGTGARREDPVLRAQGWSVGDLLPTVTKKITREKIDRYEEILGIRNPVHVDEEYAKASLFKGIIAHGLMSAAYISEWVMRLFPREWVHHGEMEIRFLHPVRPGDTVRTQGVLMEKKSTAKGVVMVFDVLCKNQLEETVVVGTAVVPKFEKKQEEDSHGV